MDDIFMSEEVCETEEYGRCSKGDASSSSAVAEARPFLLFVATARKTEFAKDRFKPAIFEHIW